MRALIVDSNIVSYIYKKDTRAALYEPHLTNAISSISFMTLAKLERWAIARYWGAAKHGELLNLIQSRFSVIESSHALCRQWAEVVEGMRAIGRHIAPADAWIAATALLFDVPLVTHNKDDFEYVPGLTIISEA